MEDDGLTPDKLQRLVDSAVNPTLAYRRQICRRLARQTYNQFGLEGLFDLLGGIDDAGSFCSVVVAEKSEIENYVFNKYGVFDNDIYEKIILSEEWSDFIEEMLESASDKMAEIIADIVDGD